jgi:CRISPR-associated protein Cmr1
MARKKPDMAPPEFKPQPSPSMIMLERHYKLITPLFGGSAVAGEVDTKHPIRGSSIRGHLRFWWRATQAGRFGSIKEMEAEEDKLWGSAANGEKKEAQSVGLKIDISRTGKPWVQERIQKKRGEKNVHIADPESNYSYVAFPLRQTDEERSHNQPLRGVLEDVAFTLTLSFPQECAAEIQATLWAWDTFGGIGARTRRGFGALYCTECHIVNDPHGRVVDMKWVWLYSRNEFRTELFNDVQLFVQAGESPKALPRLSLDKTAYRVKFQGHAKDVWRNLFTKLKEYRQKRPKTPYGRSRWPEADAIRRLTKQNHYPKRDPKGDPERAQKYIYANLNKFPRGQFGLPVIFQFKDAGDPPEVSLEGKNKNYSRLASPLILRPVVCADGRLAQGLAVKLHSSLDLPDGIVLKEGNTEISQVEIEISSLKEAQQIAKIHSDFSGETIDVIDDFLNYLDK